MEAFDELLKVWRSEDEAEVAKAVKAAADLHTMRSADLDEDQSYEFADEEYRVWPVEILAVYRLRESLGLKNPEVKHPLLDSPLGKLPPPGEAPMDPLLEQVLKKLKREIKMD
jgi:hypothetical protein